MTPRNPPPRRKSHQTAILSTDFRSDIAAAAAAMFARWHQENSFKYMRQHHGLDRLVEHGTSPLPDTTRLVNPASPTAAKPRWSTSQEKPCAARTTPAASSVAS